MGAQLWPLRRRSRQIPLCLRVQTKLYLIPINTANIIFFEKNGSLGTFLRFPVTSDNPPKDVAVTHLLISDRNIFSKQKYLSVSFRSGAHVGERNLFLSAHWTRDQPPHWMTSNSWAVCGCATGRNGPLSRIYAPGRPQGALGAIGNLKLRPWVAFGVDGVFFASVRNARARRRGRPRGHFGVFGGARTRPPSRDRRVVASH